MSAPMHYKMELHSLKNKLESWKTNSGSKIWNTLLLEPLLVSFSWFCCTSSSLMINHIHHNTNYHHRNRFKLKEAPQLAEKAKQAVVRLINLQTKEEVLDHELPQMLSDYRIKRFGNWWFKIEFAFILI